MDGMRGDQTQSVDYVNKSNDRLISRDVITRLNEIEQKINSLSNKNFSGDLYIIQQLSKEARRLSFRYIKQESSLTEKMREVCSFILGDSKKTEIIKKALLIKKLAEEKSIMPQGLSILEKFIFGNRRCYYAGQTYVKKELIAGSSYVLQKEGDIKAGIEKGLYYNDKTGELKCDGKAIHSLRDGGHYVMALFNS